VTIHGNVEFKQAGVMVVGMFKSWFILFLVCQLISLLVEWVVYWLVG